MVRNPVAAGRFYPANAKELRSEIEKWIDLKSPKEKVIGVVSPHAGFMYSGPVAGATISRIDVGDVFIVIGPNHTGRGAPFAIMTEGIWVTPLGEVEIDSSLARKILSGCSFLQEDVEAHHYEHSIEVQLPFLQYLNKDVRIVPIVLGHAKGSVYADIGVSVARAVKATRQEVVIMASSDMTHYEPHRIAVDKDVQAIESILNLDETQLLKRVAELNISMCGYGPVATLISAAREMGAATAELACYRTSGDSSGDYSSVVGYAGILIKGG